MNNGYITMSINGQDVGLKFGLRAVFQIAEKEKSGIPFYQVLAEKDEEGKDKIVYSDLGLAHVMYAGYCNNCYIKDELPKLKFEDFYNVVEDCIFDVSKVASVINPVIECYVNSRYITPVLVKEQENGVKKKNEVLTTLNPSVTEYLA